MNRFPNMKELRKDIAGYCSPDYDEKAWHFHDPGRRFQKKIKLLRSPVDRRRSSVARQNRGVIDDGLVTGRVDHLHRYELRAEWQDIQLSSHGLVLLEHRRYGLSRGLGAPSFELEGRHAISFSLSAQRVCLSVHIGDGEHTHNFVSLLSQFFVNFEAKLRLSDHSHTQRRHGARPVGLLLALSTLSTHSQTLEVPTRRITEIRYDSCLQGQARQLWTWTKHRSRHTNRSAHFACKPMASCGQVTPSWRLFCCHGNWHRHVPRAAGGTLPTCSAGWQASRRHTWLGLEAGGGFSGGHGRAGGVAWGLINRQVVSSWMATSFLSPTTPSLSNPPYSWCHMQIHSPSRKFLCILFTQGGVASGPTLFFFFFASTQHPFGTRTLLMYTCRTKIFFKKRLKKKQPFAEAWAGTRKSVQTVPCYNSYTITIVILCVRCSR